MVLPPPRKVPNLRELWDKIVAFFQAIFKPRPFSRRYLTVPKGTESTELNEFGFVPVPGFPRPISPSPPTGGFESDGPGPKRPSFEIPDLDTIYEESEPGSSMRNLKGKRSSIIFPLLLRFLSFHY